MGWCWRNGRLGSLPPPFPEMSVDANGKSYQVVKVSREIPDWQLILDAAREPKVESVKEGGSVPAAISRDTAELYSVVRDGSPTLG